MRSPGRAPRRSGRPVHARSTTRATRGWRRASAAIAAPERRARPRLHPAPEQHERDDQNRGLVVELGREPPGARERRPQRHERAVAVGHARPERHQRVHRRGAVPGRVPRRDVEAAAGPDLHDRGGDQHHGGEQRTGRPRSAGTSTSMTPTPIARLTHPFDPEIVEPEPLRTRPGRPARRPRRTWYPARSTAARSCATAGRRRIECHARRLRGQIHARRPDARRRPRGRARPAGRTRRTSSPRSEAPRARASRPAPA